MTSAWAALYTAGKNQIGGYLSPGLMFTTGYMTPGEGVYHAAGESIYHFGPTGIRKQPGRLPEIMSEAEMAFYRVEQGGKEVSFAKAIEPKLSARIAKLPFGNIPAKVVAHGGPLFAVGMSGYFMYKGYKGELGPRSGMAGVWDSAMLDISVSSAIMKFGTVTTLGKAGHLITRGPGLGKMLGLGLGAGVLASYGQSIAGTPGALIGGFIGGAAMSGMISHPLIAAGVAATVGGTYMVSKGAFALLKTGYRKKQFAKRIDTAGDTTAFMTNGAKTMRERSVEITRKSFANNRSALGMESNFLHYNRNYFSTYRQF